MTKLEQPLLPKPQINMNIIKKLIEELEMGKKCCHILRSLILEHHPRVKLVDSSMNKNDDHNDFYKALDHHSRVVMDSFLNSISMLKSHEFDGVIGEKRKHEHDEVISLDIHPCKSEVSANNQGYYSTQMSLVKNGRRECYKKRKIGGESREEVVTHLSDDGFAWRKYGQKKIHNSNHPRHYYRCTHKNEQKCEATKQIHQISENPIKYKLIYHGNHTCNNNILNTSPYMTDSPEEHSSAFVLSFDRSDPVNPFLFPPSGSSDSYNLVVSNPVLEQSEEISIGVGKDFSSATPTSCNNFDEDYSFIMTDFSELMRDWWTS